jgi:hypothetical protein
MPSSYPDIRDLPGEVRRFPSEPESPLENPLVLVMGPDPEPVKDIPFAYGQSAIGRRNPNRPERPNSLEPERGVSWIFPKQMVLLVGLPLYLLRKLGVPAPEPGKGPMLEIHALRFRRSAQTSSIGRVLPSLISRSSSASNGTPRPPREKSRSICSSQACASNSSNQSASCLRSASES